MASGFSGRSATAAAPAARPARAVHRDWPRFRPGAPRGHGSSSTCPPLQAPWRCPLRWRRQWREDRPWLPAALPRRAPTFWRNRRPLPRPPPLAGNHRAGENHLAVMDLPSVRSSRVISENPAVAAAGKQRENSLRTPGPKPSAPVVLVDAGIAGEGDGGQKLLEGLVLFALAATFRRPRLPSGQGCS